MNLYFGSIMLHRLVPTIQIACRHFVFVGEPSAELAKIEADADKHFPPKDGWNRTTRFDIVTDTTKGIIRDFLNGA